MKSTSFEYGQAYQLNQAEKHRNRHSNHWKPRLELLKRLVNNFALPRINKPKKDTIVVDVGCSIGTCAIEFSLDGFQSFGVDFDPEALKIAAQLAAEENVSPSWVCGDVALWPDDLPPIDIALCSDIFEHLHDDELGAMLSGILRHLSANGCVIFFTCPTEYAHLILENPTTRRLMRLFCFLPASGFNKAVKVISALYDIALVLTKGKTYRESIQKEAHCNPTTPERLTNIFHRLGYEMCFMETADLYNIDSRKKFFKYPVSHYSLYGVAVPVT
jgi:2-polyprenyl-3-methyl-5-hydroxy-6-metoxy-1,4-benzoquinol methylase